MANAGWVSAAEITERIWRLRGYLGIRQARRLAQLVDPAVEWPGESWTKLRLVEAGCPIPRAQVKVADRKGRTAYLDLGYEAARVGCEYDGREVLYLSGNAGTGPRQAEVIQAQLAKIGIKVKIELADFPTFSRRWFQERQWDLVQVQWDADLDPDETLYPELHSGETWNAGKWVNKDFDLAVELARAEADFKKRKKYYEDSVRAILEDAPVTILLHVNEQKIFHKYVKGFQMIPAGLIDMHRVWLDKA